MKKGDGGHTGPLNHRGWVGTATPTKYLPLQMTTPTPRLAKHNRGADPMPPQGQGAPAHTGSARGKPGPPPQRSGLIRGKVGPFNIEKAQGMLLLSLTAYQIQGGGDCVPPDCILAIRPMCPPLQPQIPSIAFLVIKIRIHAHTFSPPKNDSECVCCCSG